MKKRFYLIGLLLIAVSAAFVSSAVVRNSADDILNANVEALAQSESGSSNDCFMRESYGVKMYTIFCMDETTYDISYPCPLPDIDYGSTKRHCH